MSVRSLPVSVAHLFVVTEAPQKNCSDFWFSAADETQPGSQEAAVCAKNMQITMILSNEQVEDLIHIQISKW